MTASRMAYAIKLKEAIQYSKSAGLPTILHGQAVITSFIAKGAPPLSPVPVTWMND